MFTPGIIGGGCGIPGCWILLLLLLRRVLAAPLRLVARREMCGRRDFRENDSPGAGFYKQPPPAFAISSLIVKGCLRQQPLIKPEPEAHSLLADPGRSGSLSLLTSPPEPARFLCCLPSKLHHVPENQRKKPLNHPSSPAPLATASPTHGCPRKKRCLLLWGQGQDPKISAGHREPLQ